MYKIKLEYAARTRIDQYVNDQRYEDSITHCATIDLYVDHGIDSFQLNANEIGFERAKDRTLALLLLSSRTLFTVQAI